MEKAVLKIIIESVDWDSICNVSKTINQRANEVEQTDVSEATEEELFDVLTENISEIEDCLYNLEMATRQFGCYLELLYKEDDKQSINDKDIDSQMARQHR